MTAYREAQLDWGVDSIRFTVRETVGAVSEQHLQDVTGWFGGVGVDVTKTQRSLGHGTFPASGRRTGRAITLKAYMHFQTDEDRLIADRFVSGIAWDGSPATLWVVTGELALGATVQLDGEISHAYHGMHGVDLQIPLHAADPFLYGEDKQTTLELPAAGQGLKWEASSDSPGLFTAGYLRWGGSKPPARMVNLGNAEAWPVFTVRGDFDDGFTLTMNGRVIEYPGLVTRHVPVVVDTGAGQVTVNGRDVTHMLVRREWEPIPPKSAIMPKLAARNRLSEGWADAVWSDTYI